MSDFFDKLDEFVAAAKAKAADLEEKAAAVCDELAAWIRAHSGNKAMAASPADQARLQTCLNECQMLANANTAPAPAKGATPAKGAGGPFADFLVQLILAILNALKP